jgi:hypothetical protein
MRSLLPAFVEVILGLIPIVILAFFIGTTITITKQLGRIEDLLTEKQLDREDLLTERQLDRIEDLLGEIRDQLARRDSAAD